MTTGLLTPLFQRSAASALGLALAVACLLAPALPLGPLRHSAWVPLAVLWCAFGWAARGETGWRAPAALFGLGLIHDLISGGAIGLFAILYLAAFLIGRSAANATRSHNLVTEWGGFAATVFAVGVIAVVIGPLIYQGAFGIGNFAIAAAVTTALFPLVRPLYLPRG
ncbi:MAG: hypothetical protein ACOYJ6_02480 [Caulobacterales bacterium]|jgi:rod shape-determining protein MreD